MKKTTNCKWLTKALRAGSVVLTLALFLTAAFGAAGCVNTGKGSKWPVKNIAPEPLAAQSEPDDNGEPVTYTVNGTISSNMVVQRDAYFNVFGRSDNPGGVIYGEFMGEKRYGIVADDGSWTIRFSSHEATREGQTLTIGPKNGETTTFDDILVGDVWIISGQSNAELWYQSAAVKEPEYTKSVSKDDLIRIYTQSRQSVMDAIASTGLDVTVPREDVMLATSRWEKTTASSILPFTALGYYFGKELSKSIDVPLGLVMAASGGAMLRELMPGKVAEELGITTGASVPQCGFYNTLIHPFTRNKIAGMIFYQGESESNAGFYQTYAEHLAATVNGFRDIWELCFPFINVQLSSHGGMGQYHWPELPQIRAAQFDAYRMIENSYIVTSMDQGFREDDADWAHPQYKLELGKRAAKIAAWVLYGVGDEEHALAPEPDTITWNKDNSIEITFKHVGDGLRLMSGSEVQGLVATDEYGDKMFCEVEMIDSRTIRIVPTREPMAVSYAMFHDGSAEKANIASSDGIPMPAFFIKK